MRLGRFCSRVPTSSSTCCISFRFLEGREGAEKKLEREDREDRGGGGVGKADGAVE